MVPYFTGVRIGSIRIRIWGAKSVRIPAIWTLIVRRCEKKFPIKGNMFRIKFLYKQKYFEKLKIRPKLLP
jgi:hypothetical protein